MLEDLTVYSDQELSLRVFNEKFLYDNRHSHDLKYMLDRFFKYNAAQLAVLEEDLAIDLEEE